MRRYFRRMSSPRLARGRHSQRHAAYAVTSATRDRRPLFAVAAFARIVMEQLRLSDLEGYTLTHAWVVMPDHVHWLFALRSDDLSACLRRFKSRSARAVTRLGTVDAPVWQPGFYDHRLRDEDDLVAQAQYIIENPLRKGLVGDIHRYPHWGCRWVPSRYADAP